MELLRNLILCLACVSVAACAGLAVRDKAPQEAWEKLARGEAQSLLVQFDAAASKSAALSALPAGEIEVLKDYDALPMMYLRFRSTHALQNLLAQPSVVRAFVNRREVPMPGKPAQ
ncbi:hypothetical protein GALL_110170 [mine drainage metagenome]|uniref:Lipoprotein n=1 Tax=mine drainage metagenome TaxID=410659 RepID=A0A1J5SEB4_9ZZZZ